MSHGDIESDCKDCFAAGVDRCDPVPMDRDFPDRTYRKRKYDAAKEGNPEAIKWVEAFRASRRKANSKKKEAIEREAV